MLWRQTPSRKKKAIVFTNVTTNAYQGQLNAGFSKVCEIFKVRGIESLKYVREFHTPVWYCGDISTHRNVTLNETNCDWLFDMSVNGLMGGPWPINPAIYSRPSAVSLKIWLRETTQKLTFAENALFQDVDEFVSSSDLEKLSIASLSQQWILCSEWVPSEWEPKQLIKTSQ